MPEQIQKPRIEKPVHKQVQDVDGPKISDISKCRFQLIRRPNHFRR